MRLYIDDVINGIIEVYNLKGKNKYEILNIGKGKQQSWMYQSITKYYKKKFKIKYTNSIPNGDIKKLFKYTKSFDKGGILKQI